MSSELINYSTGTTVTSSWLNSTQLREEGLPKYVVYQVGSTFYAKAMLPGGTDASGSVLQTVLASAFTSGGSGEYFIKGLLVPTAPIAIPASTTINLMSDGVGGLSFPTGQLFTFNANAVLLLNNIKLVDTNGFNDLILSSVWTTYPSGPANEAVIRLTNTTNSPNLGRAISIVTAKNFGIELVNTGANSDGLASYNKGKGAVAVYAECTTDNVSVSGDTVQAYRAELRTPTSGVTVKGLEIGDFVGGTIGVNIYGSAKNIGTGLQITNPHVASPTNVFTGLKVYDNQQSGASNDSLLEMATYQDNTDGFHLLDILRSNATTCRISKDSNGGYFQANDSTGVLKAKLNGTGKMITYSGVSTAGLGVSAVYASYSTTGNAALVTNAINYTPPATAGTYQIKAFVNVRTAAAVNMNVTVTYKDGAGVARTETMPLNQQASTTVTINMNNTAARFTGSYIFQIDNSATAITLSTTGTTMTLYDLAGILEQVA